MCHDWQRSRRWAQISCWQTSCVCLVAGGGRRGAGSPGQGREPGPEHGGANLNFKVNLQLPIQISGVLNWFLRGYAPFVVVHRDRNSPHFPASGLHCQVLSLSPPLWVILGPLQGEASEALLLLTEFKGVPQSSVIKIKILIELKKYQKAQKQNPQWTKYQSLKWRQGQ